MKYKDDWDKAKERITAFWDQEIVDRCCVSVRVNNIHGMAAFAEQVLNNKEKEREFLDAEYRIKMFRLESENTYFGGEAFPMAFLNLGASGHAGFYKGEKHYIDHTVWFFPFMEETENMPDFDSNSVLYRATIEQAKAFVEDSKGDYFVSMPDTSGNADALSHMMGANALLPIMIDEPDSVSRCLCELQKTYEKVMNEVYDIVRENNEGGSGVGWLGTWAPGFHAQMQCDLSVMISNQMFRQFIMPELCAQSKFLEYPLYHLDGEEQIRHLDDLLSIPELRCIQWTQVVGQKPCTAFFRELKKIQAAGKNLFISVGPDQIRPIMENLSSKGLFLSTSVPTVSEAKTLLKDVAKWTHD